MTGIERAEEQLEAANDAVKQAFREVGRKGSPEHAEVLSRIQDKLWPLLRTVKAETDPQAEVAKIESIIKGATQDHIKRGGAVVNDVVAELQASGTFQKKVDLAAQFLAPTQVRRVVGQLVQRATATVAKAEEDAAWREIQPEFAFENIEEFRGLPRSIRYVLPEGGLGTIAYASSNQEQRRSSLALQKDRIKEKQDAYDVEFKANKLLEPLVAKYGDAPPPRLWAMKVRDEKRGPKASGDN